MEPHKRYKNLLTSGKARNIIRQDASKGVQYETDINVGLHHALYEYLSLTLHSCTYRLSVSHSARLCPATAYSDGAASTRTSRTASPCRADFGLSCTSFDMGRSEAARDRCED